MQPLPSLPASTTTSKADESKRDRQEFGRLREELGRVLHLKWSLERDLSILKFGLKRFKESEKDMIYTGLTFGQFVALLNFLNAYGVCYHLNYWGSDYAKLQLPDIEKKGQKHFLEADDELFLTLCLIYQRKYWLITIILVYQRSQGFLLPGSTHFFQG